jgi:hypothetical protein
MNRDRLDLHLKMANEAEASEWKFIDPNDKREEEKRRKHKEQNGNEDTGEDDDGDNPPEVAVTMTDSGRLIDLEA